MNRQQKHSDAISVCRTATEIEPSSGDAWQCLGEAAFYAEDWETAEWALTTRLTIEPNQPMALFVLGRVYRYDGRNELAAYWLQEAIIAAQGQNSIAALAWYELGYIYKQGEQNEAALQAFKQVNELNPEFTYINDVLYQIENLDGNR